jgi:hypothetical protein
LEVGVAEAKNSGFLVGGDLVGEMIEILKMPAQSQRESLSQRAQQVDENAERFADRWIEERASVTNQD